MCLDVLKPIKEITNGKRTGYKAFEVTEAGLYPFVSNFQSHNPNPYPVNTWIQDNPCFPFITTKETIYPSGFHVFMKREDARIFASFAFGKHCTKRVRFRKPVTAGYQTIWDQYNDLERFPSVPVVVAKEMMIVEKEG